MGPQHRPWTALLLAAALFLSLTGCRSEAPAPAPSMAELTEITAPPSDLSGLEAEPSPAPAAEDKANTESIDENGSYDSVDDVARYIATYGELPDNYITKDEARDLGWDGGSLEHYAPGKCIGGDRFGNYEGLLPKANGRVWTECDIDTLGANSRGAKRIVYSNDGLIYYTDDHYESFERVYIED